MYEQETRGIVISVEPDYLEDYSEPTDNHFVWAYTVRISNLSDNNVQLCSRHWKITDAMGQTEIIQGDGVVGEQPTLSPGEAFEYTSGAPLKTPSGFMSGCYGMLSHDGELFDAGIPAFSLDSPHETMRVN